MKGRSGAVSVDALIALRQAEVALAEARLALAQAQAGGIASAPKPAREKPAETAAPKASKPAETRKPKAAKAEKAAPRVWNGELTDPDGPATKRQRFMLWRLTGEDWREREITKREASNRIAAGKEQRDTERAMKGVAC